MNLHDPVAVIIDQAIFFGVIREIATITNDSGEQTTYKVEYLNGGDYSFTTTSASQLQDLRDFTGLTITRTSAFLEKVDGIKAAITRSEYLIEEKKKKDAPAPVVPAAPPKDPLDEDVPF